MKLYFGHGKPEREVAECANVHEVGQAIEQFIAKANEKNTKPFVMYYTRMWREGDYIVYDVGSWSEFFYLETDKDVLDLYDQER